MACPDGYPQTKEGRSRQLHDVGRCLCYNGYSAYHPDCSFLGFTFGTSVKVLGAGIKMDHGPL